METDPLLTPVMILRNAAFSGDVGTVRHLIDEGVDVNVWDKWGRTPLSFASGEGHQEVVFLLIKAGAWINPHEDYDTYHTPLYAAASNGHLKIVRDLIAAGADPKLHVGVSQATPEFYARQNGHDAISEYLCRVMGI